ncbi:hypothetical protein LTR85_006262 [Meristemomyces frigidus]|nr:hypothetical protein LTR85_006262 [Meristemomyces frigidus]
MNEYTILHLGDALAEQLKHPKHGSNEKARQEKILVSFGYLFYNNIWTCQLLADELLRFFTERKGLRVSEPEGSLQRSSYFLSLPFNIFIVLTDAYGPGPQRERMPADDRSRVGYSCLGILCSILSGAVIIAALPINSFRRYPQAPADYPRMATNSAALAALCQRPDEDADAYLCPVQLGVVTDAIEGRFVQRVTFSTDCMLQLPVGNMSYQYAVYADRAKKKPQQPTPWI